MNKLSKKAYILYGIGVSYFMLDQLFVQWLKYFYLPPKGVGLKTILPTRYIVLGFIIMRLVDAITDPIVGYMSDHNHSKLGRRSIFMLIGGIPLGIAMILFFFPMGTTVFQRFVYFSIIGSIYFVAYTLVGGPYNSMIPDLANDKDERINLSTVQSIFRLVFTAIPLVFSGIILSKLTEAAKSSILGFRLMIICFSLISVIGIYICALFLGESKLTNKNELSKGSSFRKTIKEIRNFEVLSYFLGLFFFFSAFNIIRGSLAYYVSLILNKGAGFVTIVSAVIFLTSAIFFPVTNSITKKYGFKKIMILDILIIILGTLGLVLFNGANIITIYIFCAIIGIGISGAAFIFPPAMLSEISTEISKKSGVSVEGLLFGIQGFFLKLAFMVEAIISVSTIVYGSIADEQGLRNATKEGVIISLCFAIVMLIISIAFYAIKKKEI